ncbi:hypothetical protein [Halarcobacter anaerophilus]|jgi:hypothetical protein|uniref:hypothetical protein n=1 Tax=Halarcobacter anaerophilus TaxID=877500 RepID=UPI0005C9D3AE|nr:hypothetical protein [Halarcobacter anaerophilus]
MIERSTVKEFDLGNIKDRINECASKCSFMGQAVSSIEETNDKERFGAMLILEDLEASLLNLYDDLDSIDIKLKTYFEQTNQKEAKNARCNKSTN